MHQELIMDTFSFAKDSQVKRVILTVCQLQLVIQQLRSPKRSEYRAIF